MDYGMRLVVLVLVLVQGGKATVRPEESNDERKLVACL